MSTVRVRFAPSPTGALHIGGARTALYNYLLAKKLGGTFILRIEDTDQTRYVPGAEDYILDALKWLGLTPDEGPNTGGAYGPYRQSERKPMYRQYADQLIANGHAYYAFDTPEALTEQREIHPNFKYGADTRLSLSNSLTLSAEEVSRRIAAGEDYTIRLKVEPGQTILIQDIIRGEVSVESSEIDDKVLMKSDGMPTYHLANIVDDHLMKISHVIRGEEWLPSTAHHVLLYRGFGWEDTMPQFAHLPLIMKPSGKGKLSKRDGKQLGIPVFPLSWAGETEEESFVGFREFGFQPKAVLNFLALLGWSSGTDQEMFTLDELIAEFALEKVSKSGARFDFDKARWFNQQYIIASSNADLAKAIQPLAEAAQVKSELSFLEKVAGLMKERVAFLPDFIAMSGYLFGPVKEYDEKNVAKRWSADLQPSMEAVLEILPKENFSAAHIETVVKAYMEANDLKMGPIFSAFRLGLAGIMSGPGIFEMMELLGRQGTIDRMRQAFVDFENILAKG